MHNSIYMNNLIKVTAVFQLNIFHRILNILLDNIRIRYYFCNVRGKGNSPGPKFIGQASRSATQIDRTTTSS